jgi:septum formation protein
MTIWLGQTALVLASQSRARQALLTNAGIDFEIDAADIDERAIQRASALESPRDIAVLLARSKALQVSASRPGHFVIGADQTLARGPLLFSKPTGKAAAADQIRALAGGRHELHSAVAVARNGEILFSDVAMAGMTMRALNASDIDAYLQAAGDAVALSVGGYQLEGLGVHLFEQIEGDHFTILGLPLLPLLAFLRSQQLLAI